MSAKEQASDWVNIYLHENISAILFISLSVAAPE